MTGDFSSRYSELDPNFAGVLHQQGRVLLDADWNAQTLITNDWQDTEARDVIGADVLGVPADDALAFKVEAAAVVGPDVQVTLDPGHAWADGLLVRAEPDLPLAAPPVLTRNATYLQPPIQNPAADVSTIVAGTRDAVVLEVWREAVSAFQQTELLEPALGGPDTTERVYTAWDLRLLRLGVDETCESLATTLHDDFDLKGKLSVTLQPTTVTPGDCPLVEGGGYTGFEHNLYRVEIAAVNSGPTMFKWSRYNGGLVGRGEFDAVTQRVTITANMQAIITSGLSSFYLETREFDPALNRWKPTYGARVTLDNNNQLVLPAGPPIFGALPVPQFPSPATVTDVFFRLWDDIRPIADFPVQATPNELVDGIRLAFEADATGKYVPEDFWTFSVRAGDIPSQPTLIDNQPPEGIHYHRVPLAILTWNAAQSLPAADGAIDDCRHPFQPLTRLRTCCTYRVGDGQVSWGEFSTIQAAIDALPADGGEVCVLPGNYVENVVIEDKRNVIVSGCGDRSVVRAPLPGNAAPLPVFRVTDSTGVRIEHLLVRAEEAGGVGILLEGQPAQFPMPGTLRDVDLYDLHIRGSLRSAIEAHEATFTTIRNCLIEMDDVSSPWHAIFFVGDDSLIERNEVRVISPREIEVPGISGDISAGRGGIQIGGTSERVRIVNNYIHHGMGNGITLGHIVAINVDGVPVAETPGWVIDAYDPCDPCNPGDEGVPPGGGGGDNGGVTYESAGALEDITIERNRITLMGLCGIGVAGFFNLSDADEFITVRRLVIIGNRITLCLQRDLAEIPENMLASMGYGGIALADVEYLTVRDNFITNNGPDYLRPICGIYLLHGEGVELSRNRILNNGIDTGEPPKNARRGARGGIYIQYAIAPTVPARVREREFPVPNGVPAAVIQNNIVSAPLGRALTLVALGPVSVVANELATLGMVPVYQPPDTTFIAATVLIFNLGLSAELLGLLAIFRGTANPKGNNVGASGDTLIMPKEGLDDFVFGQLLVNGTVLFNDNQVSLDLLTEGLELIFTSILIASLDDVGFTGNQCVANLLNQIVISQAFVFALSVRVSDNRFTEGIFNAFLSATTLALWMNITAHNEATHCLLIRPTAVSRTVAGPNRILLGLGNDKQCDWTRGTATAVGNVGLATGAEV